MSYIFYVMYIVIYRLYHRSTESESPQVGAPNCMALQMSLLLIQVRETLF